MDRDRGSLLPTLLISLGVGQSNPQKNHRLPNSEMLKLLHAATSCIQHGSEIECIQSTIETAHLLHPAAE